MATVLDATLGLLCDVSVKAVLLAAAAGTSLWLLRVRSTSVRHRVWTVVLAAMALLPVLVAVTPNVPLPAGLYPQWQVVEERALSSGVVVERQHVSKREASVAAEAELQSLGGGPMRDFSAVDGDAVVDRLDSHPAGELAAAPTVAIDSTVNWAAAVLIVYVAGVVWFLGRLVAAIVQSMALVRGGRPVSLAPPYRQLIGATAVVESAPVRVPLTVGCLRPAILLPSDWRTWSDSLLRAVLAHEQAHVRRRDHWVALAAEWNRAVYWFHPVAWFLRRRLATLAEQACDDAVIETLGDRTGYARHLLDVAGRLAGQSQRLQPAGVAMARTPVLERRIEAILDASRPLARRLGVAGGLALVAIAVPLVLLAAGLRADHGQRTEGHPESPSAANDSPATAETADDSKLVLSGRIVDDLGAPVTDATLELTGSRPQAGDVLRNYEAKTDEQGRYGFEGIQGTGEYRLSITSRQWVGITDWRRRPMIVLTPTSRIVRDFTLQRACQIGVLVVDEAGNPVKDASLYAATLAEDRHGNTDHVSTDEFGLANIGGLKASTADYVVGAYHNDFGYAKSLVPLREAGDVATEQIVLAKGGDVPARAICSDGQPAAGWKVYALPSWWRFGVSHRGAEIADDGTFTLTHIVPGEYDLNVHIPTGGGMSQTEVAATAAKLPPEGGRLELKLRSVSPQSMSAIAGKIRYMGEKPPNGFWISANSIDGENHASTRVEPDASEFRIAPVPKGVYRLSVDDVRIEPVALPNVTAPTTDLEIEIRAISQPELSGTVVDGESGQPIAQFRVRVEKLRTLRGQHYTQEPQWYHFADAAGRFTIQVVGPGIYRVLVAADGYAWARSEETNSDEDSSRSLRVELIRGATLTGTVVNEEGEPIDNATVIPLSKAGGYVRLPVADFKTDDGAVQTADGRFTIDQLLPGKETLRVSHPDYCTAVFENIEVHPDGSTTNPITVTRGGTIRGRVYDAAGRPEANVTLHVEDDYEYRGPVELHRLGTAVTDSNGFYEVNGLPEQICHVNREDKWQSLGVVRNTILPKNREIRTLDLGGMAPVSGRLLVNGKPLANSRIQLTGEHPSFDIFKANAQTNDDGAFTFWGPPTGRWTLYYLLPGRRTDWCRVRKVEVTGEKLNLGSIDYFSTQLAVQVTGGLASDANSYDLSLVEFNPIWTHGNRTGVVSNSGRDGQYVIDNVPVGTYELICRRTDRLELRQQVEVRHGERQQQVVLTWPPGSASVGGDYHNADGRPRWWNPPNLWSKDRRLRRPVTGDDDNQYRIDNLPAGDYYLTDKDVRYAAPAVEFSLADGEQRTLNLTPDVYAPRPFVAGSLALLIFTDQGLLLPGCDITLIGPGGRLTPHSSQYGRLSFVGDPGTYQLTVQYPGFRTVQREVELNRSAQGARSFFEAATKIILHSVDGDSTTN